MEIIPLLIWIIIVPGALIVGGVLLMRKNKAVGGKTSLIRLIGLALIVGGILFFLVQGFIVFAWMSFSPSVGL